MLRGDVILQRGDVDQVLGEVGAKVDDLEWSDDRRETGKLQSVGGKIDLLDLNAGRACNSSRRWPFEFFCAEVCRIRPRF